MAYPFQQIEPKWQNYWEEHGVHRAGEDVSRPKFFIMDMFPYPSGAGLHVGHPHGYIATDIIARYKRMTGYNVLYPIGFDAFGLPTERYSMKHGIHPSVATDQNIANFKRQIRIIGLGYDWSREIRTSDPSYYKWTQWIFTVIYNSWFDDEQQKARSIDDLPIPSHLTTEEEIEAYRDSKRLAYIAHMPVNWCEELGTVLANEEVDEWREKGYVVEQRLMRQWMLRITAYSQRLLDDLELVQWPTSTKEMQKHWIGRSEGAELTFAVDNSTETITVFTTRPDTVFGATYMVLAPEHELVDAITTAEQRAAVDEYRATTAQKTDLERTESKEKTGVFTGGYAINPATGERIPIWIADYVLKHYGTGSIMAVPGHDERDHAFARQFGLPIRLVVAPNNGTEWNIDEQAYTEEGMGANSENAEVSLNGVPTVEAKQRAIAWAEQKGIGTRRVQYKQRDWLFSRQRYWGEPIPIMFFKDGGKRALTPDELPLELPMVDDFMPAGTGESPLAKVESWVDFTDPKTGKRAGFETNTMPQWAGSCWYYLRYIDPHNDNSFCDPAKEQYWMDGKGVDLYIGGTEHAVLHLLYARFWHKILYDFGYVSTPEPFHTLFHQGMILGEDSRKMSKSFGNVVNPDDIVHNLGADSLRVFEMFMGPLAMAKPWQTTGIEGIHRFLNRVWRLIADDNGALLPQVQDVPLTDEQAFILHSTIKKVHDDIASMSFNTAIAQMMIFVNEFTKADVHPREAMEKFVLCIAPFAPHIAEELWSILGHTTSAFLQPFPEYDATKLVQNTVEIVLQVNSKVRSRAVVPLDADEATVEQIASDDPVMQKHMENKTLRKKIFVANKLINFIVS